jgi:hypothetical protein
VTVKEGADLLVAAGSTRPAVSSWSYGLGRSVAITAYAADGTLGGLLSSPDSLLLTRSVNWAIGDPTRGRTGVTGIEPARVGRPTTVTFVGERRPEPEREDVRFVRTGESRFEARIVPDEPGYDAVLGRDYAVNYPRELGRFGPSPALTAAAEAYRFLVEQPPAARSFELDLRSSRDDLLAPREG